MRSVRELHCRRECLLDEINIEQSKISDGVPNRAMMYELYAALAETETAIFHSDDEFS
jgi:hypothetical protein